MATHDIVVIGDYVSVMVRGSLSIPEFQHITDETLLVCQDKDIRKVIIDVSDTEGTFSDDVKLEFATYASQTLKPAVDRYAYIYPIDLITYTPQIISQGLGFNVAGFTNLDDALNWIDKK